jgi:Cu/Ag efflux protein CusF
MSCPHCKGDPMRIPNLVLAVNLAIGILFAATLLQAQPTRPAPRSLAFFGRVQVVDSDRKVVTVKHGKIPGYMDPATTEHPTEGEAVLKRLQPGDYIRATVYPNDLTLHRIRIVYRSPGARGKTAK